MRSANLPAPQVCHGAYRLTMSLCCSCLLPLTESFFVDERTVARGFSYRTRIANYFVAGITLLVLPSVMHSWQQNCGSLQMQQRRRNQGTPNPASRPSTFSRRRACRVQHKLVSPHYPLWDSCSAVPEPRPPLLRNCEWRLVRCERQAEDQKSIHRSSAS